jgi:hypothetical protein
LKKVRKEIAFFHDEVILNEKKKNLEILIATKNTLKILRGYDKEHQQLKLKSFESSVQFDISEILQNDFVSKMSKKLIL